MAASPAQSVQALFGGSDEIRSLCRGLDWGATPLGRVETWPQALRAAIRICLDAAGVPMGVCAGRDLILIYNESYGRLLGRARHPWAMGRAAREVWWECWGRLGEDLRLVMEDGAGIHREDEPVLIRRDGGTEEAFITYTFAPVRTDSGEVVAALTVVHDTTTRVRATRCSTESLSFALGTAGTGAWELNLVEQLRISEAQLKFAQEAAGAGMWHWDLSTREMVWSDQLYRLLGLDPTRDAPASLDRWRQVVHPDDRASAERDLDASISGRSLILNEHRIILPSGEVRWINALGRTTCGADGRAHVSGICIDVTERRRTEESLRASEALARERLAELEALYETAPIGLCVFDEHLRWVRANKVIAEINGRPVEDHIGRTPSEVVPDVGTQAEDALRTILATGERLDFEMTGTTASAPGVERSWAEHWVPIKDPTGRITGISVAAEEITDRKRAARALAESEERFRTLADNIAQFAWMADSDGSISWFNRRWYDYTGTTLDEMRGWGWQKVHHPAHVKRVVEKLRRCFERGEPWEDSFPLRGRDGSYRWFLSRAVPIRDEAGDVVRWFGTNTDITEQRAAEDALRDSEARFRSLADAMPQIVWSARPDGVIDYCNERVKELFGTGQRDDGTWSWEGALHPEDARRTLDAWTDALNRGHAYEISHRMKRSDGTVHWYLTRGVPVRHETGRIVQWFGTTTDIDAQKRAEQAVRETDRHKSEFLALLSHELRNPLAVVRTSLALIQRAGPESPQAKRALLVLDRQVSHIVRLLDDLLDVTRISRGKLLLQPESVELNGIVLTTGEDQSALFHNEGIDLRLTVCARPLRVHADAARVAQAIRNLLQNAAKFTPRGGAVTLSLDPDERGGAVVAVKDTGVGIPADALARVFEPLMQAEHTRDRSRGGLGLGLALVKGLVELHGGTVTAASDGPGRGALFTIWLPLERHDTTS